MSEHHVSHIPLDRTSPVIFKASVIIPVLNEAPHLQSRLLALQALREQGVELVVVDGGSQDDSPELTKGLVDQCLVSERGRARQMNQGAAVARGTWLVFLHADTALTPAATQRLMTVIAADTPSWGRFNVRIIGQHPMLRVIAWMMNRRSCLTSIATGDQCILVHRELFNTINGYPEQPLMEDIELSRRLKSKMSAQCWPETVETSGRRWEQQGVWRTILLMWSLRWRYWRGASAEQLVKEYYECK